MVWLMKLLLLLLVLLIMILCCALTGFDSIIVLVDERYDNAYKGWCAEDRPYEDEEDC